MLKIALLGAGFMGQTHLDRYQKNSNCNVTTIFDTQIERAGILAQRVNAKASDRIEDVLTSDVDVVDICLPTPLHFDCTILAAKAGKHVICEKPMALNPEQCDKMIFECEKNHVQLMIAHVLRFTPEYIYLSRAVSDERFGKLIYIRAGRRQSLPAWTAANWMQDPALSLGGVVDLQIHDLDFILSILGKPSSLKSIGTKSTLGGWEQITTILNHDNGKVSCTEACNLMPSGYPFTSEYLAVFERGCIEFNCNESPSLLVTEPDKKSIRTSVEGKDGYQNEIDYFIDCLRKDKVVDIGTGKEAKQALMLALLTKESLDTGKEVVLE